MSRAFADRLNEKIDLKLEIEEKWRRRIEDKGYYDNGDFLAMMRELEEAGQVVHGGVVEGFLDSCGPRK